MIHAEDGSILKKALVTGAAGFFGSHVSSELLADNIEVRCLIRPGENKRNLDGLDVEMIAGDILIPSGGLERIGMFKLKWRKRCEWTGMT
jgi:nucleoside-diphosphate-sugar epimerase